MLKYKDHVWVEGLHYALMYRLLRVTALTYREESCEEDVRYALAYILTLHLPSLSEVEPEDLVEVMKLAVSVYLPNLVVVQKEVDE